MFKKSAFESVEIMHRAEGLMSAASNRYEITVQVAKRAKRRYHEEPNNIDNGELKATIRAIIEMSDELSEPEILGD